MQTTGFHDKMTRMAKVVLLYAVTLPFAPLLQADNLAQPTGKVLLSVTGKLRHDNTPDEIGMGVKLDLAMLEQLPVTEFVSKTPWTEGDTKWQGVSVADLLAFIGAESDTLTLSAIDDYSIRIDDFDFTQYPVILAYKLDDKYMSVRDLGPLWLSFPFDDYPELLTEVNKARAIWQLETIVVE